MANYINGVLYNSVFGAQESLIKAEAQFNGGKNFTANLALKKAVSPLVRDPNDSDPSGTQPQSGGPVFPEWYMTDELRSIFDAIFEALPEEYYTDELRLAIKGYL